MTTEIPTKTSDSPDAEMPEVKLPEVTELLETESPSLPTVEPFDFRHPPRLGRVKRVGLEGIFGRFALSTQAFLSSRLRAPTDVGIDGIEQSSYGEYITSLASPCAAIVFEIRTDRSYTCVLDFGGEFGFFLVDRLLGGSGEDSFVKRSMTALEQTILRGVAENVLTRLVDAWQDDLRFETEAVGFESYPEVLGSICADDSVLVTTVGVDCGGFSAGLSMSIPIRAMESFLRDDIAGRREVSAKVEEIQALRRHMERSVCAAHLEVDVVLPRFTLRAGAITGLKTGDVIRTGHPTDRPVELRVNGVRRLLGTVGVLSENMSVRVSRVLDPDGPTSSWKPEGAVL